MFLTLKNLTDSGMVPVFVWYRSHEASAARKTWLDDGH